MDYPKLRIRVPDGGRRILTTVELDGKQLPATRVAFDSGDIRDEDSGLVSVTVTFYADLELEVDLPPQAKSSDWKALFSPEASERIARMSRRYP